VPHASAVILQCRVATGWLTTTPWGAKFQAWSRRS